MILQLHFGDIADCSSWVWSKCDGCFAVDLNFNMDVLHHKTFPSDAGLLTQANTNSRSIQLCGRNIGCSFVSLCMTAVW